MLQKTNFVGCGPLHGQMGLASYSTVITAPIACHFKVTVESVES